MRELQERVRKFVEENNLQMAPEFHALDIVSELGEVAKEILRCYDYGRGEHIFREEIRGELGDLLYSLITLANHYGIDLEQEVIKVLEKYERRISKGKTPGSSNE